MVVYPSGPRKTVDQSVPPPSPHPARALTRPKSGTGDIEVQVDSFTLLNPASPVLPFYPSDDHAPVGVLAHIRPATH